MLLRHGFLSYRVWSIICFVCGVAAALILETKEVQLVYGVTFSFSGIFLFLLVRLYGIGPGVAAAFGTMAVSVILYNRPITEWIVVFEVLAVGAIRSRRMQNLLSIDILFWILFGIPALLLYAMRINAADAYEMQILIMLSVTNGLFNALIADMIIKFIPWHQWLGKTKERQRGVSFSQLLYFLSLSGVAVPMLLYFIMNSWNPDHMAADYSYQENSDLYNRLVSQLQFLYLFAACAIVVAVIMNRQMVSGLAKLVVSTTDLPVKLRQMRDIDWPDSRIEEVNSLISNFRGMSRIVVHMFQQVQTVNERLHEQSDKLRRSEEQLLDLAYYDSLTSLPNRRHFATHLKGLISEQRDNDRSIAVIFADLNRFKQINDTLGHENGDLMLQLMADRFRGIVTDRCKLFRLGGDEFVIVIENVQSDEIKRAVDYIFSMMGQPITIRDTALYSSVSLGVSLYPQDGDINYECKGK